MMFHKKYAQGFTIVELMISIALGLIMVTSIIQVLSQNRTMAKTEVAMSRIQESGRYLIDTLTNEIRHIGYHGCTDPSQMNITVMANDLDADFGSVSLRGFEVAASGNFDPSITGSDELAGIQGTGTQKARIGSDVIQFKYAGRTGATLTASSDAANTLITVDANPTGLAAGDYAIVSDCQSAHIFEITTSALSAGVTTLIHAATNNTPEKMLPGYAAGSELLTYENVTYFVADTGRNKDGQDIYALYRKNGNSATPTELIEGVEFMQVLYGERVSGNLRFVPAGTSGLNMQAVEAIKIGFLIQDYEISLASTDTKSYRVLTTSIPASGTNAHAGGRYLRKSFSATVQLRNTRM